jgi:hypothetical protein
MMPSSRMTAHDSHASHNLAKCLAIPSLQATWMAVVAKIYGSGGVMMQDNKMSIQPV